MTDKIYNIYWTPTRCKKFARAWENELNDIQPEVVVQFVCKHTGMVHVTSRRQLLNGTLMFFDREFNEYYALYIRSGYVRRIMNTGRMYQLNPQRRRRVGNLCGTFRITFPNDAHALAQCLIRAYKVRHKRCRMTNRGYPLTQADVDRINAYTTGNRVEFV